MAQICDACEQQVNRVYTIQSGQDVCSSCYRQLVGEAVPPPIDCMVKREASPQLAPRRFHKRLLPALAGGVLVVIVFTVVVLLLAGSHSLPSGYELTEMMSGLGPMPSHRYELRATGEPVTSWSSSDGSFVLTATGDPERPRKLSVIMTAGKQAWVTKRNETMLRQFVEEVCGGWSGSDDWVDEALNTVERRPDKRPEHRSGLVVVVMEHYQPLGALGVTATDESISTTKK